MQGDNDLEAIYFTKEEDRKNDAIPDTEYYVKPDMIIVENGIARPKKELL